MLCISRSPPTSEDTLTTLETLSINPQNPENNQRLRDFFSENSDRLIANLIADPNQRERYLEICKNLKNNNLPVNNQNSIGYIQRIASSLRHQNVKSLENALNQLHNTPSEIYLKTVLENFSHFTLPKDIEEIRKISNSTLRIHLMAAIINRDKLSLVNLQLNKSEIKSLGPHLIYVDLHDLFKGHCSWTRDEINQFLRTCRDVEYLKINTNMVETLPELPVCKELDCSFCSELISLPMLPFCSKLKCTHCTQLIELPELPYGKDFDCSFCTKLVRLPSLPYCNQINFSHCSNLSDLPDFLLCVNLKCSDCPLLVKLPDLILCKKIDCSNSGIIELSYLPECKYLNCSGCKKLSKLPDLTTCEKIYCSNCDHLDFYSRSVVDRIQRQAVRSGRDVIYPKTLSVNLENLNKNPINVLFKLDKYFTLNGDLPRIQFIEKDGRKAKNFTFPIGFVIFSKYLMKALILNSGNKDQLKFEKTQEDLYIPVLDPMRDLETQMRGFKGLAIFFNGGFLNSYNSKATLENYLDQKLFDAISLFSKINLNKILLKDLKYVDRLKFMSFFADQSFQDNLVQLGISQHLVTGTALKRLNENVLTNFKEVMAFLRSYEENSLQEKLNEQELEIQKAFMEKLSKDGKKRFVTAAFIIAKQLQNLGLADFKVDLANTHTSFDSVESKSN